MFHVILSFMSCFSTNHRLPYSGYVLCSIICILLCLVHCGLSGFVLVLIIVLCMSSTLLYALLLLCFLVFYFFSKFVFKGP